MEHIVFLDRKDAIRKQLRPPAFPHTWTEYMMTAPEQLSERLSTATIAIANRVPISHAALDVAPSLRLVAVAATGYDHVDVAACRERGVAVCNVRDWSISVPEHVFAMMLALRRQLFTYREAIQSGEWQGSSSYCLLLQPIPRALSGSTMGLIGYGALAKRVEKLAKAFEMNVLIADHKNAAAVRAGRTGFEEVLSKSDVVVVLCPLNAQTRNLISHDELSLMRPDALLVNCARGGIVDEVALAQAMKQGLIGGAATDVLSQEPPVQGNPLLDLNVPNLIVTPHIAWASVESQDNLAEQLIGNIEAFVAGTPRNLVTN